MPQKKEMKKRVEKKANRKQMMFKLSGKFNWQGGTVNCYALLPDPRNVRYYIQHVLGKYDLHLERMRNKYGERHGSDLYIGRFNTLDEAKNRAELREARYEVKKAARD